MFKGKYNELVSHQTMIQDYARTQGFFTAIEKAVTSNDTVIDFGSGTGILAIKAAKCGAKRVIAIERNPATAQILQLNAERNNVNIEIFIGNAKQFIENYQGKLNADVVISECIGDHIFENSMVIDFLSICKKFNAVKRIPENFRLYTPNIYFQRKQEKFDKAKQNLILNDIDISFLTEEVFPNTFLDVSYFGNGKDDLDYYFKFQNFTKSNLLYDFSTLTDMMSYSKDNKHITTKFSMPRNSKSGDYIMLYWDIDLYNGTKLTNSPMREETYNHSYFQRMVNVTGLNQKDFTLDIDVTFDKIGNEDSPCENITIK